jgi:hypothetical protein
MQGYFAEGPDCQRCPPAWLQWLTLCSAIAGLLLISSVLAANAMHLLNKSSGSVRQRRALVEEEDLRELSGDLDNSITLSSPLHSSASRSPSKKKWYAPLPAVVGMVINHVSLIGAFAKIEASQQLALSIRRVLDAQQSANGFALGAYLGGFSCLFPADWSDVVLRFNATWIMFAVSAVFGTTIFSLWLKNGVVTASTLVFLAFLFYSPLAQSSARLVSLCNEYPFYDANSFLAQGAAAGAVAEARLLSADLGQDCDDPSLASYRAASWLTLLLFNVGAPVAVAIAYKSLSVSVRLQLFGFLLQNVREEAWFWELAVAMRKLCVALILGVLSGYSYLQLQLLALISASMLAASLALRPRRTSAMNDVEMYSMGSAQLLAALLSTNAAFPDIPGVVIFVAVVGVCSQAAAIISICVVGWRQHKELQDLLEATSLCPHLDPTQDVQNEVPSSDKGESMLTMREIPLTSQTQQTTTKSSPTLLEQDTNEAERMDKTVEIRPEMKLNEVSELRVKLAKQNEELVEMRLRIQQLENDRTIVVN